MATECKICRTTCSWNGFGFGIWRNVWYSEEPIWTICLGPLTIHWSRR